MKSDGKSRKYLKGIAGVLGSVILLSTFVGTATAYNATERIDISGSTTVFPIVELCREAFMDEHKVQMHVSPTGSGTGIKELGRGTVEIAMASRELKYAEREAWPDVDFYEIPIAHDGVAVIVSKSIYNDALKPVTGLTIEQVRGIYNGTIRNWNLVGGPDKPIAVHERQEGSGTRDTFMGAVFRGVKDPRVPQPSGSHESNAELKSAVAETDNAIGYVGLGYVNDKTPSVMLNGVLCSPENIVSEDYPISRMLYLYTDGEPSGMVKEFIDFVLSEDGQDIVSEEGFIRIGLSE